MNKNRLTLTGLGILISAKLFALPSYGLESLPVAPPALAPDFCAKGNASAQFSYKIETNTGVTEYVQEKRVQFLGTESQAKVRGTILSARAKSIDELHKNADAGPADEDKGSAKSATETAKQYLSRLFSKSSPAKPDPVEALDLKDDTVNPLAGILTNVGNYREYKAIRLRACAEFVRTYQMDFQKNHWKSLSATLSPTELKAVCHKRVILQVAGIKLPQFCISLEEPKSSKRKRAGAVSNVPAAAPASPRLKGLFALVELIDALDSVQP